PGESDQLPFLQRIMELKAGLELQSYGLKGICSQEAWDSRYALHQEVLRQYRGPLAMHGPFLGISYHHPDAILNEAVGKRMDMAFQVASKLGVGTIVLHSGYDLTPKEGFFEGLWLDKTSEYWRSEIVRWEEAGIRVAIENYYEMTPDLLVEFVDRVESPSLGLCFDIGHWNLYSEASLEDWIRKMGNRLFHIHVHDNDGEADTHFPLDQGNIDFALFYNLLKQASIDATISVEAHAEMETKVECLEMIIVRWSSV
ncbi:sugar phosphate isomerase/epimerase family protein, partial [Planctomycetota bacterium]